jgi:hypothetical protein
MKFLKGYLEYYNATFMILLSIFLMSLSISRWVTCCSLAHYFLEIISPNLVRKWWSGFVYVSFYLSLNPNLAPLLK